jgi:hypothetical protein
MGFFAILRDDPDSDFDVIACHLNLWSLGGLLGHKLFLFDVGLRLKNKQAKDLTKIRLALPFGTDKESLTDLHDLMLNQSVAQLIFGKPVTIDDSTIDYEGGSRVLVARVSVNESQLHGELSNSRQGYSLWSIKIAPTIRKDEECYVRVRFELRSLGRTWVWKRSGISKTGAIVDLRIADVRQAVSEWKTFEDQLIQIQAINVFVIAPPSLQFRATSPSYHYMRLLEGRVWEPYLRRKSDIRRSGKLVIFEWRNDANSKVDTTCPFRVLLDLSREFGLLPLSNHLLMVTLLLASLFTVYYLLHHATQILTIGLPILNVLKIQLTAGGAIAIILWVTRNHGPIKTVVNAAKKLFLGLERFVYKA